MLLHITDASWTVMFGYDDPRNWLRIGDTEIVLELILHTFHFGGIRRANLISTNIEIYTNVLFTWIPIQVSIKIWT